MDMIASANTAILSTKNTVDNFSEGLEDLADSVGLGRFLAIVAGALVVGAGLGGISFTGIARMDEYFGWPLWSSIFPSWRRDDYESERRCPSAGTIDGRCQEVLHSHTQKERADEALSGEREYDDGVSAVRGYSEFNIRALGITFTFPAVDDVGVPAWPSLPSQSFSHTRHDTWDHRICWLPL
ncbi:hypothetical protein Pcinc_030059 [Petrolisthes cinctipes]|uniref:Uncharacterized protein n=1 Tax=Petrolisthes cinctipes TaxID=88211 RepID=A0AAE1EYT3_PETCI|nr:hypothetical protein Pcinc_030059 [Petrolisthes cinctipes]